MERGIREGMTVHSSDGERLGKIVSLENDGFFVEKGLFFPKEYFCRFDFVSTVDGDDVRLSRTKDELTSAAQASSYEERSDQQRDRTGLAGARLERDEEGRAPARDEVRMTAAEEELEAVKRVRDAGEVRLRKDVVTETKHIEVPVTREEVRVERIPVEGQRAADPGEARFERDSVSMPVREEEVEIRKRPVVKEEVRLRRERVQGEQRADAEVRREEIRVDDESHRAGESRGGLGAPGSGEDLP